MCGPSDVTKKASTTNREGEEGLESQKQYSVTPSQRFPSTKAFDWRHKSMLPQRRYLAPNYTITPHAVA